MDQHLLVSVQVDVKSFLTRAQSKSCGTGRREERHPPEQDPATCSHRHTDITKSNAPTRKTCCVDCGTYIDAVPLASSNRNEELADRITRDTTITKQQNDLATRMMLDQVSRLSDGDWTASIVQQRHQLHLFRSRSSSCTATKTKH